VASAAGRDVPGIRDEEMNVNKTPDDMTNDELKTELERLKESLCDLEDMHAFTFGKTTVHIGAEKAHNMQLEFEEECDSYRRRIAELEKTLEARNKAGSS
jgi:ribosomal protein L29